MFFSRKPPLLVGLDIGTSAIKIAVGERRPDGGLTLLGCHSVESRGVRKGEVVNHAEASLAILQAIQETEDALNMDIGEVDIALTGGHIQSANHRGTVVVQGVNGEVTEEDIADAVEQAKACVLMGDGRTVIHVIRQQFYVDGKDGVRNPLGQIGTRLEADAHCIHGINTRFLNTLNCLRSRKETTFEVKEMVFSGLASSLAVLSKHEKEVGSILLDIGAGTTEYVVYAKGMMRQTGVLALGGDHLINDLLLGLKLQSRHKTEALIREHGSVWLDDAIRGKTIKVRTSDLLADRERTILLEHIHIILKCRMDEILRLIYERIRAQGLDDLVGGGVVVTGGCSRIHGLSDLAQSIFDMPVRIGASQGFDGHLEQSTEPEMSTVVGVVKFGHMKRMEVRNSQSSISTYLKRFLGIE
jgi:cell division protein FtsA